jgi:hypothetical protein
MLQAGFEPWLDALQKSRKGGVLRKRVNLIVAAALILLSACEPASGRIEGSSVKEGPEPRVDRPEPPVIDGRLTEEAWQAAEIREFSDGSRLILIREDGYLYLGIEAVGEEMIAGNVFLQEGDRIRILHTSAALGTASYHQSASGWQKESDFGWCCRSRIDSEAAQAEREVFSQREGWLGANSFLGEANQLEYRIELRGQPILLAVNFILADDPEVKQVWPVGLMDGVAQPAESGFPEWMEFDPGSWYLLPEPD